MKQTTLYNPDIFLKIGNRTYIINNGRQVFKNLFEHCYKVDTSPSLDWEKGSETHRDSFKYILPYFTTDSDYVYIDEDFIQNFRMEAFKVSTKSSFYRVINRVPWFKLRRSFPQFDNDIMLKYVITPFINYQVRLNDLIKFYSMSNVNLDKALQCAKVVHNGYISSSNVLTDMYQAAFDHSEVLEYLSTLLRAYTKNIANTNLGFPTLDRLCQNIFKCEDRGTQIRMTNTYTKACEQKNLAMVGINMDSKLPAAWQSTIETKGTILDQISWDNICKVVPFLFGSDSGRSYYGYWDPNTEFMNRKFKSSIRGKSAKETIQLFEIHFKNITGIDLTFDNLVNRYDWVKEQGKIPIHLSWNLVKIAEALFGKEKDR